MATYIQAHEQPGDVIMPLLYQSMVPLIGQYYHGELSFEPLITQGTVRSPETFSDQYRRLWYVAPHYHDSTHFLGHCRRFDLYTDAEEPQIQRWLKEHEDQMAQRVDLHCVSVLLYDLTDE